MFLFLPYIFVPVFFTCTLIITTLVNGTVGFRMNENDNTNACARCTLCCPQQPLIFCYVFAHLEAVFSVLESCSLGLFFPLCVCVCLCCNYKCHRLKTEKLMPAIYSYSGGGSSIYTASKIHH